MNTSENYIRNMRSQGYSDEQIRASLAQSGWQAGDIESVMAGASAGTVRTAPVSSVQLSRHKLYPPRGKLSGQSPRKNAPTKSSLPSLLSSPDSLPVSSTAGRRIKVGGKTVMMLTSPL